MGKYIDKDVLVAEIKRRKELVSDPILSGNDLMIGEQNAYFNLLSFIESLEAKEVDNVWHEVDNVNLPQPDKNKVYCVLSQNKYLLAKVINHPHDELLQWKCTEFPFHRYDMCEGDKYMQIV